MRATLQDQQRLEAEVQHLVQQLISLGEVQVILFGSLARGQISLFSDIDQLVLFNDGRSPRELTRWVYQNIHASEAVDILAYDRSIFEKLRDRPFFQRIIDEGEVLYERPEE